MKAAVVVKDDGNTLFAKIDRGSSHPYVTFTNWQISQHCEEMGHRCTPRQSMEYGRSSELEDSSQFTHFSEITPHQYAAGSAQLFQTTPIKPDTATVRSDLSAPSSHLCSTR